MISFDFILAWTITSIVECFHDSRDRIVIIDCIETMIRFFKEIRDCIVITVSGK